MFITDIPTTSCSIELHTMQETIRTILQYLKDKQPKLAVIATADVNKKPECAVMGYAITDILTIILSTHKNTRKVLNISENPQVAVTIGWTFTEVNIQIEGIAKIVVEGEHYNMTEAFFFSQNPHAKTFKTADTVFIEIKPTWIRKLDLLSHPPKIEEYTL